MVRKVTVIPPTINPQTMIPTDALIKRRVAGYARVSTDSDEQFTSYEAQIDYYTQYIKNRADWEFVKVYTDEGISGTNTKRRVGFNTMIKDALDGKIDLIVTKSISRFARNTVDMLSTIRKLKEHGVEVFFEKENIYTFDSSGEVMLTILSSIAQEESRSISENVTWGHRKRFADGKILLPYKSFLGYKKGADDLPEIVPEEAEIVKRIYKMFLDGMTQGVIAKTLQEEGVPTPGGKTQWRFNTIDSILSNEKYKGDALLQKKFTVDFLTKKQKVNEGEVPQYYVQNSHPAIIAPEEWDLVQRELARRKKLGGKYRCTDSLCCRIVCGDCGEFYGSKTWHSTSKYKRVIWQCNSKFKNDCKTPTYYADDIKDGFVTAINEILKNRDDILDSCRLIYDTLIAPRDIDKELAELTQELEIVTELTQKIIQENSSKAMNQGEFCTKYNALVERYEKAKEKAESLQALKEERLRKADELSAFMFRIHELDVVTEFDNRLWQSGIDIVTAYHDGRLVYKFVSGHEVTIQKSE